jgi:hypothetical protein
MDWHWTWQDPVAVAASFAGMLLAFRAWRHTGASAGGCASCPMAEAHGKAPASPGPAADLPTHALSIGRPR